MVPGGSSWGGIYGQTGRVWDWSLSADLEPSPSNATRQSRGERPVDAGACESEAVEVAGGCKIWCGLKGGGFPWPKMGERMSLKSSRVTIHHYHRYGYISLPVTVGDGYKYNKYTVGAFLPKKGVLAYCLVLLTALLQTSWDRSYTQAGGLMSHGREELLQEHSELIQVSDRGRRRTKSERAMTGADLRICPSQVGELLCLTHDSHMAMQRFHMLAPCWFKRSSTQNPMDTTYIDLRLGLGPKGLGPGGTS